MDPLEAAKRRHPAYYGRQFKEIVTNYDHSITVTHHGTAVALTIDNNTYHLDPIAAYYLADLIRDNATLATTNTTP
jgi:hypothetical protein